MTPEQHLTWSRDGLIVVPGALSPPLVERLKSRLRGFHAQFLAGAVSNFSLDNETALASLLAHPRYRHDYASPMPDTDADFVMTEVHGPYPLDNIDQGRFHKITADDAATRLRDWAADHDDDPSSYAGLDKHLISLVETVATIYLLDDFRDGGEHDYGWILGAFLELVVIDRPQSTLTLLVATSD